MATIVRFCRYELRTTDVAGARAFYAAVLGDAGDDIVPLPEAAAARGAPSHWLGHLAVEDVEEAARRFVEQGATRLGPTRTSQHGELAIMRDPGGAVVGFATPTRHAPREDVVWHVLNTGDVAKTIAAYGGVFGWTFTDERDLGALGVFRDFAWRAGGPAAGAFSSILGRPGVHPHWLFHFRVTSLDTATATVRARGGLVLPPIVAPTGARIAVCDDPQGAAFALLESGSKP